MTSYVTQKRVVRAGRINGRKQLPQTQTVLIDGERFIVVRTNRDEGEFHLRLAQLFNTRVSPPTYVFEDEVALGFVYGPMHPSMNLDDIEGATYAYDDGTHFHLAHCSPDEQIDFAADVENYVRAEMQDAINRAQTALTLATTALGKTDARHKVDALGEFARAAGSNAHHRVVTATLGYWHRNPHKDHRRDLAVLAMEAVLSTWAELGTADTDEGRTITAQRAHVLSEVNEVLKRLKKTHSIEWRADRQKRLNDAEAAKGTDPVDGYEYCYTRAVFPAVITGEANLPSPTWNFDALRNGNSLRGNYVYYDAEPPVTRYIAHIIRFKRPIPEGTKPGADIGSVAWEQEAAYTKDD